MDERSVPVSEQYLDRALEPLIEASSIGKGRPPNAMLDGLRTGLPRRDPGSGRGRVGRRATALGAVSTGAPSVAPTAARDGASR